MKKEIKLNYKNTTFIGLAFFSILMLWQVYNTYCPLFLSDLLNNPKNETYIIGCFMAADNVFALFLLPFFGNLSDKTKSKFGKRMPYIVIGMLLAASLFPLIPLFYRMGSLIGVSIMMFIILFVMHMYRTPAVSLMPDVTPKPLRSKANGIINLVGYFGPIAAAVIKMFMDYKEHPYVAFIFASICLLIACVVLMITIKENKLLDAMQEDLRYGEELSQSLNLIEEDKPLSKGDKKNLVILLISVFIWYMAFNAIESFLSLYCLNIIGDEKISGTVTIVLTVSSVITFIPAGHFANKVGRKLSILIGIGCLIVGFFVSGIVTHHANPLSKIDYNQSAISVVLTNKEDTNESKLTLGSDSKYVITYKDNTTKEGSYQLSDNYIKLDGKTVYTYDKTNNLFVTSVDKTTGEYIKASKAVAGMKVLFFVLCAVAGIGWALINVNSYPMVAELASQKNIGKVTSYYYVASMVAQSSTPIVVGLIMAFATGYSGLFYYSAILSVVAFVVFMLYKENKEKVKLIKRGLEAFDQD